MVGRHTNILKDVSANQKIRIAHERIERRSDSRGACECIERGCGTETRTSTQIERWLCYCRRSQRLRRKPTCLPSSTAVSTAYDAIARL